MAILSTYLENDIFGFSNTKKEPAILDIEDDKPIKNFSVNWLVNSLQKLKINGIEGKSFFISRVQWGYTDGAVRIQIDNNLKFLVERLITNKKGYSTWILFYRITINKLKYAGYEDKLAEELFSFVKKVYNQPLQSYRDTYDLKPLINKLISRVKIDTKILFYDTTQKITEDYYTICFSLRGEGVGKLASIVRQPKLTPRAFIDLRWNKEDGIINIVIYSISIDGQGNDWVSDIPYLNSNYSPDQSVESIVDTVINTIYYL